MATIQTLTTLFLEMFYNWSRCFGIRAYQLLGNICRISERSPRQLLYRALFLPVLLAIVSLFAGING